jgi:tRNA(Ile2)-agmatinylcytidine synthase
MAQGFFVGFDDTDSPRGLCTTFLATRVIEEFSDFDLLGYPSLVRLNPNIPWKTRGNGAVSLRFGKGAGRAFWAGRIDGADVLAHPGAGRCEIDLRVLLERLDRVVLANSAQGEKATNPAVFVSKARPPAELYTHAVRELVNPADVLRSLRDGKGRSWLWRTHRGIRGIVGASAAAAWPGRRRTYEIIAYRERGLWGTPRAVTWDSVLAMDRAFRSTFNNIDERNRHLVIAPHSPCPVLFGIRASGPGELLPAASAVDGGEPPDRLLLFRTNQGTDDHLQRLSIDGLRPYVSPVVRGKVASPPRTERGGHVFFRLEDPTGSVDCAAYEPTKEFRAVVRALAPGDVVEASGGVHAAPFTLNLEKLRVVRADTLSTVIKPRCSRCGGAMRSRGRNAGFRCRRCRTRAPPGAALRSNPPRHIKKGVFEVPRCARRHLSRPIDR